METQHSKSSRNVPFLIGILIVAAVMGIMFLPQVNSNVMSCMNDIAGASGSIDQSAMTNETHTIFQTMVYSRSIHVLAMLLLGFGFLMVFVRGHGFSSLTATLIVTSVAIPLYMLIRSFLVDEPVLDIETLLWGEFAAASLLIAIGAPLGRLKMDQFALMAFLFTCAYFFNEWLILDSGLLTGFQDTGGSVVIHAFGAYFGLGVVAFTDKKFAGCPECESSKTSNMFCLLGSLVLWVFWPSFTSAIVDPSRVILTVINTVFALAAASLATYVFSKLIRGKIDIEDIANAALAGGVAIGSTCDIASPGLAIFIGLAAGTLSVLGYAVISGKFCSLIKGTDTCGVQNLHGMPGILGGLFAIVCTGNAGTQILGIVINVVVAFVLGRLTGAVIGCLGRKEIPYSDEDEFI
ncbi:MAG: ammonium transporter [Eubacteriaceae bacterium]|jgi:ammonium transporter Rh|nr:ammonium transporter [Eubacteriaceae bacterium]